MESNLILDLYDDPQGRVLKAIFPTSEKLPGVVKTAHCLSDQERQALADDCFAVVVVDGQEKLRKYAMVDPGNVALSTLYLLHQAGFLPEKLVKTAAANLVEAHEVYGMSVPEPLQTLVSRRDKTAGDEVEGAEERVRGKLAACKCGVCGQTKCSKPVCRGISRKKEAEESHRYVEVEPLRPQVVPHETQRTLLGDRYPVDSFEQVKLASQYFRDHWWEFDPFDRHTYCVKLAARMEEIGEKVPPEVARYGHEGRSARLPAELDLRKILAPAEFRPVVEELLEKSAEYPLSTLAELVREFDEASGLDRLWGERISDPALAVFGPEKFAEEKEIFNENGYILREDHLETLSENGVAQVTKAFGEEFGEKFRKSPMTAFQSLSPMRKEILARLAFDAR
jgi:hypothetical protein